MIKITDHFVQVARLRLGGKTQTLPNGCVVGNGPSEATAVCGVVLTFARAAWAIRHRRLPTYRLRTTCRTAGCCNPDHLEEKPPVEPRDEPRDPARRLTEEERAQALALYDNGRMRLQDVGDVFGVSAVAIHKLVNKARASA